MLKSQLNVAETPCANKHLYISIYITATAISLVSASCVYAE